MVHRPNWTSESICAGFSRRRHNRFTVTFSWTYTCLASHWPITANLKWAFYREKEPKQETMMSIQKLKQTDA